MTKIFVSYRRSDSQGSTGRLYDHLMGTFEQSEVFMDVDSIEPGDNFVNVLDNALAQTDIMLAVIGPSWLTVTDEVGRRRIDSSEDFVRREIATAIARGITVIPVLVERASMPLADSLPEDLSELSKRQYVQLHHENFGSHVQRLAEVIKRKAEQQKLATPKDFGLDIAQEYNKFLEFVSPLEIDFVQIMETTETDEGDVEWFYNPHPHGDKPRFIVRGLPDLDDKIYRLEALNDISDLQREHYSELSNADPLIIVSPKRKHYHDDLQDYTFWLVENEDWSEFKYVRCEACEVLQIDKSDDYYDDAYAGEGLYYEWCPHCETECERCGERTGKGGFCSTCQARFDHYMEQD